MAIGGCFEIRQILPVLVFFWCKWSHVKVALLKKRLLSGVRVVTVLYGLVIFLGGCTSKTDIPLPDWLARLPAGLEVVHSQEEVKAVLNSNYPERGAVCKWAYQTLVLALGKV